MTPRGADTIEVDPPLAPAAQRPHTDSPSERLAMHRSDGAGRVNHDRLSRFVAAGLRRRRHSRAYSRLVMLMKVVFPAAAVALAALVLLWPQLNPLEGRFRLKAVQVNIDDLANLRMVSPRVLGTDKKNEPYTVTATLATQAAGGSDITDLTSPKGDISLNDGSWLAITAKLGQYNKTTRILDLWDHVNVFHDAGYELNTERARADLGQGSVVGNDPVEGHGPDSALSGEGFRIYDKGARILVTGKSRLVLYHQQQVEATPSAQPPQSHARTPPAQHALPPPPPARPPHKSSGQ